jgi:outer membrane protein TolC
VGEGFALNLQKTLITISCLVLAVLAGRLPAADPQAEPEPGVAPDFHAPAYADPDNRGLSLIDAVRLTLQHDANLELAREDANSEAGRAVELAGEFDWLLEGELGYQHEEKELRDSVKRREQERRDDLTVFNRASCTDAERQTRKAAQIEQALAGQIGAVRIDTDQVLDLQLQALERLIREATRDEATALINQWNLILESELLETRALAQGSQKACRESGETLARLGGVPTFEEFDTANLQLRAQRRFRNGFILQPFLEGEFESTQYLGKHNGYYQPLLGDDGRQVVEYGIAREEFIDFGGKNIEDLYTFRVGFDVAAPLLRGRGIAAAGAGEKAAQESAFAVALLVKQSAAESVRATALAYWEVLAAQQRVAILEQSVANQDKLVNITGDLVKAEQLSQVEGDRAAAGRASAAASLESARQELIAARHELLRTMGFDLETGQQAPVAAGDFPRLTAEEVARAAADAALLAELPERRYDIAAARLFSSSSTILLRAADLDLRPRLDASAGLWSTATGESGLSEGANRWVFPSYSLGLELEKPIGNHAAKGRQAQSRARLRQDQITAADLERTARLSALLAMRSLGEAAASLAAADAAAVYSENLVAAEQDLLNAGESSVLDGILTEERTTSAKLAQVEARLNLATLLVELRFETGTLVSETEEGPMVTLPMLSSLPAGGAAGG